MEVLLDPPGHVRLPINDDEIVDRTVSIETAAGQPVRLVSTTREWLCVAAQPGCA